MANFERASLPMKRCTFLLTAAVFLASSNGCAVFQSGKDAWTQTFRMTRPRPHDGPMEMEDDEDEWGFVGDEGRADRDRETDPDRWWHNLVMSPEARNIERNLGID